MRLRACAAYVPERAEHVALPGAPAVQRKLRCAAAGNPREAGKQRAWAAAATVSALAAAGAAAAAAAQTQ